PPGWSVAAGGESASEKSGLGGGCGGGVARGRSATSCPMLLPLLALETAVWSPLGPGAAWIRNAPSSETRLDHEPEQPQSKSSLMPAGGVSERPPLVPKTPSRASFACDVVTDGAVTVAVLLETR